MSLSSSLHVGLVWDLMLQRLWYLAAAVTDMDLERGLDRARSWFVRLLGESSLFSGFRILSKWRFSNYMLSPSPCQSSGAPDANTGMLEAVAWPFSDLARWCGLRLGVRKSRAL